MLWPLGCSISTNYIKRAIRTDTETKNDSDFSKNQNSTKCFARTKMSYRAEYNITVNGMSEKRMTVKNVE